MGVKLKVAKFDTYLVRKDVRKFHWFRLDCQFFEGPSVQQVSNEEKLIFIYCLAEASRVDQLIRDGTFELHEKNACFLLHKTKEELREHLRALIEAELISEVGEPQINTPREKSAPTENIQNRELEYVREEIPVQDKVVTTTREEPTQSNTPQMADNFFLNLWNQERGHLLPQAKQMNATRRKQASQRWKENPDMAYWLEVMRKIRDSDFCTGRVENGTGWVATFDWLLKPDSALKVMEGKYDNRKPAAKEGFYMTPARQRAHNNQLMREKIQAELDKEEAVENQERVVGLEPDGDGHGGLS